MHRNIWAVGRNYAEHAKEMNAQINASPLIFLKAGSTLNLNSKIQLPSWSQEVHHEIEIALLLKQQSNSSNFSFSHITLAIDLTARDKQAEAKKSGAPWTLSKSFSGATPLAPWIPIDQIKDLKSLSFQLSINEKPVQKGFYQEMIFSPEYLKTHIQEHFPLCDNDILLTGTPAGVGPLQKGDKLNAILLEDNQSILTCQWSVE